MDGFPGDSVVKRHRRFNPRSRKYPWRRKWQPTPVLLPGKFHGRRSLVGYSPWDRKQLGTTEQLGLARRRKWQRTPVFLPGKSYGRRSLSGCSPQSWRVRHDLVTELKHNVMYWEQHWVHSKYSTDVSAADLWSLFPRHLPVWSLVSFTYFIIWERLDRLVNFMAHQMVTYIRVYMAVSCKFG